MYCHVLVPESPRGWKFKEKGGQNPRSDQLHKNRTTVRYCLRSSMFNKLNRSFSHNEVFGDYVRDVINSNLLAACTYLYLILSQVIDLLPKTLLMLEGR
jgi:hypothetical protein